VGSWQARGEVPGAGGWRERPLPACRARGPNQASMCPIWTAATLRAPAREALSGSCGSELLGNANRPHNSPYGDLEASQLARRCPIAAGGKGQSWASANGEAPGQPGRDDSSARTCTTRHMEEPRRRGVRVRLCTIRALAHRKADGLDTPALASAPTLGIAGSDDHESRSPSPHVHPHHPTPRRKRSNPGLRFRCARRSQLNSSLGRRLAVPTARCFQLGRSSRSNGGL